MEFLVSTGCRLMLQEYLARRKGGNTLLTISRTPYGPMAPRAVQRMLKKIGERTKGLRRIRHTFNISLFWTLPEFQPHAGTCNLPPGYGKMTENGKGENG